MSVMTRLRGGNSTLTPALPGGPTRHLRQTLQVNYGLDLFYEPGPRLELSAPAEYASFMARAYVHNIGWAWRTSAMS